nr:hypothetical protein [Tanacetum cinerariifolium]
EFTDEYALITYPSEYDDNLQFDVESDLKEIEYLLYQDKDYSLKDSIDQKGLANLDAIFTDPIPEMFVDEHTLDYSSPSKFDVYDDDFLEVEFDAKNVYDDPFDSKGEKIKESKLLIDDLDLPCDFLPPFEYDSSSSRLISDQSSNPTLSMNPKGCNRRRSKQRIENSNLEEQSHHIVTMIDNHTMAEMLRAPTEGRSKQRIENSNLEEQSHHIVTMIDNHTMAEMLRAPTEGYKDLLRACPHLGFTKFHQFDTFYNALNPADQDSLNAAAGGNLLERSTQDVLTIIENKSKLFSNYSKQPKLQSPVKAVEETCVTCTGTHPYYPCLAAGGNTFLEFRDNIQGYVSAAAINYNQGSGSLPSNTVANPKGELKAITTHSGLVIDGPIVPTPPQSINPKEDERVEETFTDPDLAEYTIKKMLKALLSNKEKLQELANTPLNENYSAVILKKLPEKLEDLGKFLIPCGFSELKCKSLADLANRAIYTPAGIARDVFVLVGKFTFLADFIIVDYKSDPRVPLILGRPFLRTARALIDVHGEEMILRDGDERLTLNMRHDTSSYSNQPQKESINLINVFNNSSEDYLEDLFPYQPSGNPTFSLHPELTSPKVNNDIFDSEGCNVLSEKLLDLDSTKDLHPPLHDNPLSGSTTYFLNPLLEEFADELPPKYDDNLHLKDSIDQKNHAHLADIFVDSIPEMFIDGHTLDYSSPPIFDVYDDDLQEVEFDAENIYNDPFDSKGEKIKESKLLIDKLDLPYDFHPLPDYNLFISQDFSRVDALPSTNNEDKIFNPCILIQEKPVEIITRVVQDKNLAISNASLVLEDFDPPFYEPLFFKEVPNSKMVLPFSSENKEKVFKPWIHTSKKVHSYFIPKLSHQGYKVFKINQIFKSLMKNFLFYCGKNTHILAVPHHDFYPLDQFKYRGIGSSSAT